MNSYETCVVIRKHPTIPSAAASHRLSSGVTRKGAGRLGKCTVGYYVGILHLVNCLALGKFLLNTDAHIRLGYNREVLATPLHLLSIDGFNILFS